MKKITLILLLIGFGTSGYAQYNKEKITKMLSGGSEKTWDVTGVNVERPEKSITFNTNSSAVIETTDSEKKNVKWTLKSSDEIRWFINFGEQDYELVISYDKKGKEFVKLTHQANGKGDYQLKLTTSK